VRAKLVFEPFENACAGAKSRRGRLADADRFADLRACFGKWSPVAHAATLAPINLEVRRQDGQFATT
jgi:hypothetical protein